MSRGEKKWDEWVKDRKQYNEEEEEEEGKNIIVEKGINKEKIEEGNIV